MDALHEGTLRGNTADYRLIDEIGEGGFGLTYRAENASTGEVVAVKRLRFDRLEDWKAVELFEREANVLSSLDHPSIPDYIDHFVAEEDDLPPRFVLVQEFVDGDPLDELSGEGRALDDEQMVGWFRQILEVCDYLHGLNPPVIHRDIAPKNIIVRDDGTAFLVDFGTVQARVAAAGDLGSTAAGTFGFAAMEQFVGRAVPASDLYGLAMSFLAARSGLSPEEMPFNGNRVDVSGTLQGAPVRLPLADLLQTMTEPDPRDRPQSAAEVIAELDRIVGSGAGLPVSVESGIEDDLESRLSDELGRGLQSMEATVRRWQDARETILSLAGSDLWSLPPDIDETVPAAGEKPDPAAFRAAISDDGRWAICADSRAAFVVELDTMHGQRLGEVDTFDNPVLAVDATGETAVFLWRMTGRVHVARREARSFEVVNSFDISQDHRANIAIDPDGTVAAFCSSDPDDPILLANLETGSVTEKIACDGAGRDVVFGRDGSLLVNYFGGAAVYRAGGLDEIEGTVAVRRDGGLYAVAQGSSVVLTSDPARLNKPSLSLDGRRATALRFSPNGRLLAVLTQTDASDAEFVIFDVNKRALVGRVVPPFGSLSPEDVGAFGITSDGGRLVYRASSRAGLYDREGDSSVLFFRSLVRERDLGHLRTVTTEMNGPWPTTMPLLVSRDAFHAAPYGMQLPPPFRVGPWHRPEITAACLLDADPALLLEGDDRDLYLEYRARFRYPADLVKVDGVIPGPGMRDVVEAAAGLGYLWIVAFPRAAQRSARSQLGGSDTMLGSASHDALIEVFEELRAASQAERDERFEATLEIGRQVAAEDARQAAPAEVNEPKPAPVDLGPSPTTDPPAEADAAVVERSPDAVANPGSENLISWEPDPSDRYPLLFAMALFVVILSLVGMLLL